MTADIQQESSLHQSQTVTRSDTVSRLGPELKPFQFVGQSPERSRQAYRLIKFCMGFKDPALRERFKQDPARVMQDFGLSSLEMQLVNDHRFAQMHRYGVPMVAVGKLQAVLGVPMTELRRQVREMSSELSSNLDKAG